MGPEAVLLKCDLKNAFNERKREHILAELYKVQSLQPIWRIAQWAYKDVSELLLFDHGRYCETILSAEGVKQGDCLGSLLFAVSMQPLYRRCILGSGDVRCIAVADDLNLVGQASAVFKAFDRFEKDLSEGSGLALQKPKCAILWPRANLPEKVRADATKRGLSCRVGTMETLGGLVGQGDDAYNQWLAGYINSFKEYFDMLLHPELPIQVAMLLLRLSAVPRIGFLTSVIPPRLLDAHARRFDELVFSTFIKKCGLPSNLPNAAKYVTTLPVRLGGLGLRSAAAIAIPAYYCSFTLAVRDIIDGVIPVEKRQELLLPGNSQAPFVTELYRCWKVLSDEGVTTGPKGLLPPTPEGLWNVGAGNVDTSKQGDIVAFLTTSDVASYLRAPTTILRDRQRLISASATNASAWLTAIPSTPELAMSDTDYSLAVRHRLGLPCADGLPVKCACDVVLTSDLSHFHSCRLQKRTAITARHDFIVRTLAKLFRQVGAVVHVEPRIYGSERLRPDLDITFPDQSLMVDVAVTHPAAPSRNSTNPLAAAGVAEQAKFAKYQELASKRAATFLPFVLESYGAIGRHSQQVLKILQVAAANSAAALPSGAGSFRDHAVRCLSMALQKGNALVARRGATEARVAVGDTRKRWF